MLSKCCQNISMLGFSVIGIFGLHICIANTYQYICIPTFSHLDTPYEITKYLGTFASPVCSGLIDLMKHTQNTYSMVVGAIFTILMSMTLNSGKNKKE